MDDSRLLVIATGGTISSLPTEDGSLNPASMSAERLWKAIPGLRETFHIDVIEPYVYDSIDMSPYEWIDLARVVSDNIKKYKGIVILHGIDTMAYTAAALSYMLRDIPCPIVLTGSNTPLEFVSSDAKKNIFDALRVASIDDIGEVVVVFDGKILRGNRIKQIQDLDYHSFQCNSPAPLGYVSEVVRFSSPIKKPVFKKRHLYFPNLNTNVHLVHIYPGIRKEHLKAVIQMKPKGIVLVGYGRGAIPRREIFSIIPVIEDYINSGGYVVMTTQVYRGICWMNAQQIGQDLLKIGVISLHDMTYESALVKMMWVLGQTKNPEEIRQMLQSNYSGEIEPDIMEGASDHFEVTSNELNY